MHGLSRVNKVVAMAAARRSHGQARRLAPKLGWAPCDPSRLCPVGNDLAGGKVTRGGTRKNLSRLGTPGWLLPQPRPALFRASVAAVPRDDMALPTYRSASHITPTLAADLCRAATKTVPTWGICSAASKKRGVPPPYPWRGCPKLGQWRYGAGAGRSVSGAYQGRNLLKSL
ncbi:hypothetical protein CBM2633_P160013 [Cupriavidus taiwanensis]|uniref:Uncharacterized protein n=1 Tax=Cupriavidus taiwanensis TaxID=164546 RepID=A0A375GL06_9BURK|nr:hypothetical protein CBM2588_P180013 [Cupriavidus taiwanensis]SOY74562.1 hypothetical protein CBM2592_P190012 [Cupriavidus taiwanensis]SOY74565.1 hypothetical protein CBM2585_P160014 [Cupriavidus taiwanensis]SOY75460.1 hypothetical protein CBM2589_P160012 [Cupriavidus taiwanensis]SOY99214.1 hypothetical protein CBM2591_P190014 [Cupriavidus taiwanensis]